MPPSPPTNEVMTSHAKVQAVNNTLAAVQANLAALAGQIGTANEQMDSLGATCVSMQSSITQRYNNQLLTFQELQEYKRIAELYKTFMDEWILNFDESRFVPFAMAHTAMVRQGTQASADVETVLTQVFPNYAHLLGMLQARFPVYQVGAGTVPGHVVPMNQTELMIGGMERTVPAMPAPLRTAVQDTLKGAMVAIQGYFHHYLPAHRTLGTEEWLSLIGGHILKENHIGDDDEPFYNGEPFGRLAGPAPALGGAAVAPGGAPAGAGPAMVVAGPVVAAGGGGDDDDDMSV